MTNDEMIKRPIVDWPYSIADDMTIWSQERQVPAKNGSTKTVRARPLKSHSDGFVKLSDDAPREKKISVTRLYRLYFSEYAYPKPQTHCRKGQPLVGPHVTFWGWGNRICRRCNPDLPDEFANGPSGHSGTDRMKRRDNPEIAALVRTQTYRVETFSSGAEYPAPPNLVPDGLRWLDRMMRERPRGAYGVRQSPGVHGFSARPARCE